MSRKRREGETRAAISADVARFLGVMRAERALATEQRPNRRAGPKPRAVAPPAQLQQHAGVILPPPPSLPPQQQQQRRGGWFQKCQELSDAVLNGDHDRSMELAYRSRGRERELEKLEQAQDHGYCSKK